MYSDTLPSLILIPEPGDVVCADFRKHKGAIVGQVQNQTAPITEVCIWHLGSLRPKSKVVVLPREERNEKRWPWGRGGGRGYLPH